MGNSHECCGCNDVKDGNPPCKIQPGAAAPTEPPPVPTPASVHALGESDEESDDEGPDDEEFEKQMQMQMQRRASQVRRTAVSAEKMEVDTNFRPPVGGPR